MSTPIVDKPEFAKDKAVGKPILPTPITHIFKVFSVIDRFSCSKSVKSFELLLSMIFTKYSIFSFYSKNWFTTFEILHLQK